MRLCQSSESIEYSGHHPSRPRNAPIAHPTRMLPIHCRELSARNRIVIAIMVTNGAVTNNPNPAAMGLLRTFGMPKSNNATR